MYSYLDAGDVGIESLHTLGVVVATVTHRTVRGPDRQWTTVVVAGRTVSVLGRLIHHLCRRYIHSGGGGEAYISTQVLFLHTIIIIIDVMNIQVCKTANILRCRHCSAYSRKCVFASAKL